MTVGGSSSAQNTAVINIAWYKVGLSMKFQASMNCFTLPRCPPVTSRHGLVFPLRSGPKQPRQLNFHVSIGSTHAPPGYLVKSKQRSVADYEMRPKIGRGHDVPVHCGLLTNTGGAQWDSSGKTMEQIWFLHGVNRAESCRFFSSGAGKPAWTVPKQHQFGPVIPDNSYYGEHATYPYFVLFVRGVRPYLEKLLGDSWRTLKEVLRLTWTPLSSFILRHNPEFRLQLAGVLSFLTAHAAITGYFNGTYQRLVDISSLLELQKAQRYASEGFWLTASEQQEHRLQQYAEHRRYLELCWQEALREATLLRSFDALVGYLKTAECLEWTAPGPTAVHGQKKQERFFRWSGIPPPLLWSFSALPYGKDNPHTQTFPVPGHEQPLRAFALSFTTNNLSGDWGDYVNRQDNKNALMRPARVMFTDELIPPTK